MSRTRFLPWTTGPLIWFLAVAVRGGRRLFGSGARGGRRVPSPVTIAARTLSDTGRRTDVVFGMVRVLRPA